MVDYCLLWEMNAVVSQSSLAGGSGSCFLSGTPLTIFKINYCHLCPLWVFVYTCLVECITSFVTSMFVFIGFSPRPDQGLANYGP